MIPQYNITPFELTSDLNKPHVQLYMYIIYVCNKPMQTTINATFIVSTCILGITNIYQTKFIMVAIVELIFF